MTVPRCREPRKVARLFGERRNNGVSELFVFCTEMSDTKFVTTRAKQRCGETPGQGQKNDIQTDRRRLGEKACPQQ